MKRKSPFHDTVLFGAFTCTGEWKEIILNGKVKVERDVQRLGINFRDPFAIDLDGDGWIIDKDGEAITPEIFLLDSEGARYGLFFTGALGKKQAHYKPVDPLLPSRSYDRLEIRCQPVIEVDSVIWTTYSIRDLP